MKVCSKCKKELLATREYFYQGKNKDGLSSWCKECTRQQSRKYKKENYDIISDKQKDYYYSNKGYWKRYNDEYYLNDYNLSRKQLRERAWRRQNPDKVREHNQYSQFHKKHEISKEELLELYNYTKSSCMYCGLSEEKHKEQVGQKLHRDHAINLGSNGIDNCLLACRSCNTSKHDKDWFEWYTESNPVFTVERYLKIIIWLDKF